MGKINAYDKNVLNPEKEKKMEIKEIFA